MPEETTPADQSRSPGARRLSTESLVAALYQALLGRESDPSGFAFYRELLGPDPDRTAIREFARTLAESEEGASALAAVRDRALTSELRARQDRGELAFVSLGSNCVAAHTLQRLHLRGAAYPFDWIFSDFRMIDDCLADDCASFLDREQHARIAEPLRPSPTEGYATHTTYQSRYGLRPIFHHHDISEEETYAYFCRTVERFRALRRSPARVIYLAVGKHGAADREHASELARRLCRPGIDVLVAVEVDDGPARALADAPHWSIAVESESLVRVSFRALSRLDGLRFAGFVENQLFRLALVRLFQSLSPVSP